MLQGGVALWEVAGYLGATEKVIRDTYGHHSPDYMQNTKNTFQGPSRGKQAKGA